MGALYLRGRSWTADASRCTTADRLGMDHRQLQQFITSRTCPFDAVRARLAWRALGRPSLGMNGAGGHVRCHHLGENDVTHLEIHL